MPADSSPPAPASQADEWDLFISYRHRDKVDEVVVALHEELESEFRERFGHSLRVFLDRSDIRGFDDWMVRSYRALRSSRFFLACISTLYLKSDACRWEWEEWQKRELESGRSGSAAACVWFVEAPELEAGPPDERARLWIQEIRQRHGVSLSNRLESTPNIPRGEAASARVRELADHIAQRLRLFSLNGVQGGNIRLPSEHFVGRKEELARLAVLLSAASPSATAGLSGVGGVGKSALAFRYAFDHASEYPGGRWLLPATERDSLVAVIRSLHFDLQIEFSAPERQDNVLAAGRILAELRHRGRALLVFDDVDKPALLAGSSTSLLPRDDSLRVLFTTRHGPDSFPDLPLDSAVLTLDRLAGADARDLIRRHQPKVRFATPDDESAADEVVRVLDGLAIAVETAAVYLGRYAPDVAPADKAVTIQEYAARLRGDVAPTFMERLHATAANGAAKEAMSQLSEVTAVIEPTFRRLSYESGTVVGLASLLPPEGIVLEWLRAGAAEFHPDLGAEVGPGEASPWHGLLRQLISLRLLSSAGQPGVLVMHPLLQGAFRRLLENDLDALESKLAETVLSVFRSTMSDWRNPAVRWQFDLFAWIAKRWVRELIVPGLEFAAHVGAAYRALGEYGKAEDLLRYALRFAYPGGDRPDPAAFSVAKVLASILRDTSRAHEAAELLIGSPRAGTSEGDRPTMTSMQLLEPILETLSDLDNPEEAAKFGAAFLGTISTRNDPALLDRVISHFAVSGPTLGQQGRERDAEALMWLTLGTAEAAYGPDDIKTALPRNNLGQYLHSAGKLGKAEQLLRKNVELWDRHQPESHLGAAVALHNLALVLNTSGMSAEAEAQDRRALDLFERELGNTHPDLAPVLAGIASALGAQGKHKEALPYLRREFVLLAKLMSDTGQQHTYLKRAFDDYAACLLLAGHPPDELAKWLEDAATEGGFVDLKLRSQ